MYASSRSYLLYTAKIPKVPGWMSDNQNNNKKQDHGASPQPLRKATDQSMGHTRRAKIRGGGIDVIYVTGGINRAWRPGSAISSSSSCNM